jgi:transposase
MDVLELLILDDAAWARMAPHIIGDERTRISSGRDNRTLVETVPWIVRTGSPWRDLPEALGSRNGAFRRLSRWSAKGVWHGIFVAMAIGPDFAYAAGQEQAPAMTGLSGGNICAETPFPGRNDGCRPCSACHAETCKG